MTEDSNNAVSSSFLLDDDSRLNMKILQYLGFFTAVNSNICLWVIFNLNSVLLQHSVLCG